jgi:hypothetical protein
MRERHTIASDTHSCAFFYAPLARDRDDALSELCFCVHIEFGIFDDLKN